MSEKFFKIRNRDGLFSSGGQDYITWSRIGKVWKTAGHLSLHFTNLTKRGEEEYLAHGAEVVEMVVVQASEPVPAADYIKAATQRAEARKEAHKAAAARWERQRDEAELERLQRKLGKS